MDMATWVAIVLPLFVLLFIIFPSAQARRIVAIQKRKRGVHTMTNELLKKYLGRRCIVSTGSFGNTAIGVINAIEDNWIEVETKQGPRLLNVDYVTSVIESKK